MSVIEELLPICYFNKASRTIHKQFANAAMNLPNEQDYLDDLPQVLLNRANISARSLFINKGDSLPYLTKLDEENIVDSTLIQVTKSEINEINNLLPCEGGLEGDGPPQFEKDCFKFATQCPEISSQKRERSRSYGGSKVARRLREPPLNMSFPSKHLHYELKIVKQPEEQHRARYLTEGSRGTVKDKTGQGHPMVKLIGYDQPVTLQVFVGSDSGKIKPHGFYQACKVSHKNSSACIEKEVDGTAVIELPMDPKLEMTTIVDCVGILKLRNADVEQRIGLAKSKKKSTIARLVFRINIPKSDSAYQTLQVSSTPILCTQPTGAPEISKKSLNQSGARGGEEMFIIGKNFMKGTTVYFEEVRDHKVVWSREADIDQDFFQSTHLVCTVPPYLDCNIKAPMEAQIIVNSSNRTSEPVSFTYVPCGHGSDIKSFGSIQQGETLHSKSGPYRRCADDQLDGSYLKRSYALSEVSPGELNSVPFLNGSDDNSHMSEGNILPSVSPHLANTPMLGSPLMILPKDPHQGTMLENINPTMLTTNFSDDRLSFADESVNISLAMSGDKSMKHDLAENGEPCYKRLAQNFVTNDSELQAFIEMVNDNKSPPTSLSELNDQKNFPMMWSQDVSKTGPMGQSISGENLNFSADLRSYSSPAPSNLTGSHENLGVEKTFLTLSPLPGPSNIMESFTENMTFIHNLSQNRSSRHQSPSSQMFLISSSSNTPEPTPRLTELGLPDYMKMDGINVDREQNFQRDFLLSEKMMDAGMGRNLQESLSELKNLTSKVGVCNQDENPMASFVDQNLVTNLIKVDENFMYPTSISNASLPMSAGEQPFEGSPMGSFPALSTSYEMVPDLGNFSDLGVDAQSPSDGITAMSYDDKSILSMNLMDHAMKNSGSGGFSLMEAHQNSQNLQLSHHLGALSDPMFMSHGNNVDISSIFRPTPDASQVFAEKGLDQAMTIQFEPDVHQNCIIADSGNDKSKGELYYLLTEEMPANILAPLTQQNQISPLPNLSVEEVSQVLNMTGS